VVANTSTINRNEMVARQLRVGSGIADDPIKKLLLHLYFIYSQQRRCYIEVSSLLQGRPASKKIDQLKQNIKE
jgi:hypothetical protein